MNCFIIPGIKKIEYCPKEDVILYPQKHLTPGNKISVIGNFEKLPITNPANCIVTPERTNAGLIYKTKLTAETIDSETIENVKYLLEEKFHFYRIIDAYNNQHLLGGKYKPFPEIKFTRKNESLPSGTRYLEVEISWISTLPPIPIKTL